jgi:TolB protein
VSDTLRRIALLLVAPLLTVILLALPSEAQETLHIYVGAPGRQEVPLALAPPLATGNADADAFLAVVRRDLELTGWFKIVNPAAFVEPKGTGIRPGEFKYEDWDIPGAVALAKTGLSATSDGKLRAEVWVYDVPGRRKLGAKAFTTAASASRTVAHRVAGEIIYLVTGQKAPFNTRFAFSGKFGKNKEIYLVDFDGHGVTQITKNGTINIEPNWAPGGSALAFTSYAAGNPDTYIADLAKGKIRRLSARSGLNTGAVWAPGGTSMAITLTPGGDPEIYTIDPTTGKEVARLTNNRGIDTSPSWSPDGSRLAFVSDRSGGAQVYVMGRDGSGVRRVTFQGGHNTDPSWSPDGRSITFVGRDSVFDIFTVGVDGGGVTRITQHAGDNENPSFSPDGNYIGFSSTRAGGAHIWMSTVDGAHQVQLTEGKGGYTNPSWSPFLEW